MSSPAPRSTSPNVAVEPVSTVPNTPSSNWSSPAPKLINPSCVDPLCKARLSFASPKKMVPKIEPPFSFVTWSSPFAVVLVVVLIAVPRSPVASARVSISPELVSSTVPLVTKTAVPVGETSFPKALIVPAFVISTSVSMALSIVMPPKAPSMRPSVSLVRVTAPESSLTANDPVERIVPEFVILCVSVSPPFTISIARTSDSITPLLVMSAWFVDTNTAFAPVTNRSPELSIVVDVSNPSPTEFST